jgi:hypothetical protein
VGRGGGSSYRIAVRRRSSVIYWLVERVNDSEQSVDVGERGKFSALAAI